MQFSIASIAALSAADSGSTFPGNNPFVYCSTNHNSDMLQIINYTLTPDSIKRYVSVSNGVVNWFKDEGLTGVQWQQSHYSS
jgi:hypothetical protein